MKKLIYGCTYNGKLMLKVYTKKGVYLTSFNDYIKRTLM